MRKLCTISVLYGELIVSLLVIVPIVSAAPATISHSYKSATSLASGSIVSLDPTRSGYVESANSSNAKQLLGVVVASGNSLVAINPDDSTVQVATSDTVDTLVSTLNGPITAGDAISVSAFDGIGMKAISGARVIGLSQTALTSSTSSVVMRQVTNKSGVRSQIAVGYVRLSMAIGSSSTAQNNGTGLNNLQKFAQSLTGRAIPTVRVATSLGIAVVAFLILTMLVYASIYGGIISVGRNPLAKNAILQSVSYVLVMVFGMASLASFSIFLLLH
jgi:hypothetical protein